MTSTGRRGGAGVWAGATVVGGEAWVVVVVGEAATITEIRAVGIARARAMGHRVLGCWR